MAYTLGKAVQDVEERLGPYTDSNWRMGDLIKIKFEHSPMSNVPLLSSFFEQIREHSGSRRSPNMYYSFFHYDGTRYQNRAGTVFRMTSDFSEPTSGYFSSDLETDLSHLWSTPVQENGLTSLWNNEKYFRMPTYEVAGKIRFKLN